MLNRLYFIQCTKNEGKLWSSRSYEKKLPHYAIPMVHPIVLNNRKDIFYL